MMNRVFRMVLLGGFLLMAGTVEAAGRRLDGPEGDDGVQPKALWNSGPRLMADTGYETPPPAPAVEGNVPLAPIPMAVPPGPSAGPQVYSAGPPIPSAGPPMPMPSAGPMGLAPVPADKGVLLYPCVKYKDKKHIAPCAVPMVVAVRDPCEKHHLLSHCKTPPRCVMVEICVPPCGNPKITCKHDGAKVKYDYGKYAVKITSRHGVVVVNYD
jgi:hypothetical protein